MWDMHRRTINAVRVSYFAPNTREMTWNRYALLCSLGTLAAVAGAQDLSSPGNVPVIGSTFPVHVAPYVAPLPGGNGVVFDHSALVGTGTLTYTWIAPDQYSDPATFPSAQMAVTGRDTVFYRATAEGLERVGDKRNYLGLYTVEAPLTDGVLELKLPLAFGDTWNDNTSGSFSVDASSATRTGSITGVADGAGHLHLPGGAEVHVLRVFTQLTETTVIDAGFPITVTHKRSEYAYYTPWVKMPVMRMYRDTLASAFAVQDTSAVEWLDEAVLRVADHTDDAFGMELFPNPASTAVDIAYLTFGTANMTLQVTDMRGAIVLRKDLGRRGASLQREHLDLSTLDAGLYQVALIDASGAHSMKRLTVVR